MPSIFSLAVDVLYSFKNETQRPNFDDGFLPPKFIKEGIPYFGKIYHILQVSESPHKRN